MWEYSVLAFGPQNSGDERSMLSAMGAEGWELVTVTVLSDPRYRALYFKRRRLTPSEGS